MYSAFVAGSTLNIHRAASPLVRLVKGEERWKALVLPQDVLPQNWDEIELNRTVTCTVLKAKANDKHKMQPFVTMNFSGFDLMLLLIRTRGHETTPLRVKEDIEDVSGELGKGGLRIHFLYETFRTLLLSASYDLIKTVQDL
ncbi:hypothetical protein TNCV_3040811 [Trichonephila clavipes]|nr:hypothetical protein TNCV_3040811 [Trichonephila clavipes]